MEHKTIDKSRFGSPLTAGLDFYRGSKVLGLVTPGEISVVYQGCVYSPSTVLTTFSPSYGLIRYLGDFDLHQDQKMLCADVTRPSNEGIHSLNARANLQELRGLAALLAESADDCTSSRYEVYEILVKHAGDLIADPKDPKERHRPALSTADELCNNPEVVPYLIDMVKENKYRAGRSLRPSQPIKDSRI